MSLLEDLAETLRLMDEAKASRDLDIFLSDNWHAYRILRDGGKLVQVGGQWYAVDKSLFTLQMPKPKSFMK